MDYLFAKLAWMAAKPGMLLTIGLLGGVLLLWRRRQWRAGRALLTGVMGVGLALMLLQPGAALLWLLENHFPANPPLPAQVDGIIVLGGAVDPLRSRERAQVNVNDSGERLLEFARLAQRFPQARLVFTGGSGDPFQQDLKEAALMPPLLQALGVDPARVLFEDQSRTTFENARLSRPLAQVGPGETWVLVTSARHMPRAVASFRAAGWPVIAWPADFRTDPVFDWQPGLDLVRTLGSLEAGLYEWAGLTWYRLSGKTQELLPAP